MRVVKAGEDTGFVQVSLDILGLRNSLGAWDFDGNGAVEIIIEALKDLTESALPQPSEDYVTPDLRRMKERERDISPLTGERHVLC
jgi:hypothetical protein